MGWLVKTRGGRVPHVGLTLRSPSPRAGVVVALLLNDGIRPCCTTLYTFPQRQAKRRSSCLKTLWPTSSRRRSRCWVSWAKHISDRRDPPADASEAMMLICSRRAASLRLLLEWMTSQISVSNQLSASPGRNLRRARWLTRDIAGSAPASATQAKAPSPGPQDISAFPALEDENAAGSEVRVTGYAGAGKDEDMAQFESSFPDLSGEVGYEAVCWTSSFLSSQHG